MSLTERLLAADERLERLAAAPQDGPRILFFSGGTALREACAELIKYTWNSVHIVTPFDSGGSSAELRREFDMPAVGDARNRILALADPKETQAFAAAEFLASRLPREGGNEALRELATQIARGAHPGMSGLSESTAAVIKDSMTLFLDSCSERFNFSGASIGNMVLTAMYLRHERATAPAIDEFSALVAARGTVRMVLDAPLDLKVHLEDGKTVVGQHRITGKTEAPISSRVSHLRLHRDGVTVARRETRIEGEVRALITDADMICYPVGSFFSSIVANLLPGGVPDSVAANACPKVFVPNLGLDPELVGMSLTDQVNALIEYLRNGAIVRAGGTYLDGVIIDPEAHYPGDVDCAYLESLGLEIVEAPLLDREQGLVAAVPLIRTLMAISC
ncbi:GAK system CofD-like protein [Salidesulfovibrio onnuriiensis]|uniref:GAK system CofD-like protein n=1 Tax=Salidesulfovibrio onnuriiensis TaxID=2583823 RepID=UPI0011CC2266|nr:GAK system CofD-like protein [Salidesulfovibrio onnuriiensis]